MLSLNIESEELGDLATVTQRRSGFKARPAEVQAPWALILVCVPCAVPSMYWVGSDGGPRRDILFYLFILVVRDMKLGLAQAKQGFCY